MKSALKPNEDSMQGPSASAESLGNACSQKLTAVHRSSMGQYFTPRRTAAFLASMFGPTPCDLRLLDPGAGVGSLSAAFIEEILMRPKRPKSIHVIAWESEKAFVESLERVLRKCAEYGERAGVPLTFEILQRDFLEGAVEALETGDLFGSSSKISGFTHAILNPPYRKINTMSTARRLLRQTGLETSNLYTGFMWLSALLLAPNGQLVSINPRSFCNGPYFSSFRTKFFEQMYLDRVHVFHRRDAVFSKDDVLQENIILSAYRAPSKVDRVSLSKSEGTSEGLVEIREVPIGKIFNPKDKTKVLHLSLDETDDSVKRRMEKMPAFLEELGIRVSTGRVVDFRARPFLRRDPVGGAVPLIYPMHFNGGGIHWPCAGSKKPNALVASQDTEDLLVSNGVYVLVKRFTSKEEKKRVVATVFRPEGNLANFKSVGFENHLNYFYSPKKPMDEELAMGLAVYLNSTFVDCYFRQFSGHTQVNATDLRSLKYPTENQLRSLSKSYRSRVFEQSVIDETIDATL